MSSIQADGFAVTVKRSRRRKTMALKVHNGEVSVHLPQRLPLHLAQDFINAKTSWIQRKLAEQRQQPMRSYQHGSRQPLLGIDYPLQLTDQPAGRQQLKFDGQTLNCRLPLATAEPAIIKQLLTRFYRRQATDYLLQRCQQLASRYGFRPGTISVRHYKARWGSCRSNGDIQLNWQLIQAPPAVIDYVIIHELCHLKHLNHSKTFWQLVEQLEPDFRSHRLWLKHHGQQLLL